MNDIIFSKNVYEAIKELPDNEQLQLYKAIFEKYFNNNGIELNGVLKGLFILICFDIDNKKKNILKRKED